MFIDYLSTINNRSPAVNVQHGNRQMKQRTQIIFTFFFAAYLETVLLTDISLTEFWTDVIFSICISFFALRLVFKNKTDIIWLTITLKTTNILCSLLVFGLLGLSLISPFAWDVLNLEVSIISRLTDDFSMLTLNQ